MFLLGVKVGYRCIHLFPVALYHCTYEPLFCAHGKKRLHKLLGFANISFGWDGSGEPCAEDDMD